MLRKKIKELQLEYDRSNEKVSPMKTRKKAHEQIREEEAASYK
jgi:hypothetical protein